MSLLDKALDKLIHRKRTITSPIFIKDFVKENQQLKDLIELAYTVNSNKKKLIDKDIKLLKYGMDGEQNVYYELKNSFIPMLCLHDIRLEYKDHVAQFDFILITNKFIYLLESKKLSGDIEVTSDGDFIRIMKNRNAGTVLLFLFSTLIGNKRTVPLFLSGEATRGEKSPGAVKHYCTRGLTLLLVINC